MIKSDYNNLPMNNINYVRDTFMDLVTIIMPAFNREKEIKFSIKNILNQSYRHFELIIIDDGSQDDTVGVIKSFKDSRIKLIRLTTNHGASEARNIGIKNAKGDFITFLDSDDFYKIDKINKQLIYLKDTNADVVFCGMKVLKDPPEIIPSKLENKNIKIEDLLNGNLAGTPSILARKECFDLVQFDQKLKTSNDWDLIMSMSLKFKIFLQKEILVYYSNTKNSLSSTYNYDFKSIRIIYEKYLPYFLNNNLAHLSILNKMAKRKLCRGENSLYLYIKSFIVYPNINTFVKIISIIFLNNRFLRDKYCK